LARHRLHASSSSGYLSVWCCGASSWANSSGDALRCSRALPHRRIHIVATIVATHFRGDGLRDGRQPSHNKRSLPTASLFGVARSVTARSSRGQYLIGTQDGPIVVGGLRGRLLLPVSQEAQQLPEMLEAVSPLRRGSSKEQRRERVRSFGRPEPSFSLDESRTLRHRPTIDLTAANRVRFGHSPALEAHRSGVSGRSHPLCPLSYGRARPGNCTGGATDGDSARSGAAVTP
jgi:hypothetical protein